MRTPELETELWVMYRCETCDTRGVVGGETGASYDIAVRCPDCNGRAGARMLHPTSALYMFKDGSTIHVEDVIDFLRQQASNNLLRSDL